jgi:DNA-binding CsgD family transcriptional regulator
MYLYENIALVNATVILFMGFYILRIDRKRILNILFFAKCLTISVYIIFATAALFAGTRNGIIYYKLTMIAGSATILVILLFYLELTKSSPGHSITILLFLPAAVSVVILLSVGPDMFNTLNSTGFSKVIPNSRNPFIYYWAAYLTIYCAATCVLMRRWRAGARLNRDRIPAKIILISSAAFATLIVTTDIILPIFSPTLMPYMAPLFFSLYIGSVFYCLIRYRFMSFGKNDMIKEIFSNVGDFILILDPEWNVLEANCSFLSRMKSTPEDIKGKRFQDLIESFDDRESRYTLFPEDDRPKQSIRIVYSNRDGKIVTDSNVSKITDRFGDFSGILVVSRENQGIQTFRNVYRLTSRQMELILLVIDGYSNMEIAERLNISRRTVETHIFNIYSKLRISNRIELMKITQKFSSP